MQLYHHHLLFPAGVLLLWWHRLSSNFLCFFYLFLSDLTQLENNRLPAAVIVCHPPIQALGTPPSIRHPELHTPVCFKPETSSEHQGDIIKLWAALHPSIMSTKENFKELAVNNDSHQYTLLIIYNITFKTSLLKLIWCSSVLPLSNAAMLFTFLRIFPQLFS